MGVNSSLSKCVAGNDWWKCRVDEYHMIPTRVSFLMRKFVHCFHIGIFIFAIIGPYVEFIRLQSIFLLNLLWYDFSCCRICLLSLMFLSLISFHWKGRQPYEWDTLKTDWERNNLSRSNVTYNLTIILHIYFLKIKYEY